MNRIFDHVSVAPLSVAFLLAGLLAACGANKSQKPFDKEAACEQMARHAEVLERAENVDSGETPESSWAAARESERQACLLAGTKEEIACKMAATTTGEFEHCRRKRRAVQQTGKAQSPQLTRSECERMLDHVINLAEAAGGMESVVESMRNGRDTSLDSCVKTVTRSAFDCALATKAITDIAACEGKDAAGDTATTEGVEGKFGDPDEDPENDDEPKRAGGVEGKFGDEDFD
jgi:hypothetical protein